MSKAYQLIQAEFVKDHVLRLCYADGVEILADFGPYFKDLATPKERVFARPERFKRFKIYGDHALEWGHSALVFSAERLRKGRSPGVLLLRPKAAA